MAEDKKQVMHGIVQKIAANKKYRLILVVIGLGLMAVLFLSGFLPKNTSQTEPVQTAAVQQSAGDYAKELEGNLTEMLEKISGVGTVQVMVTIEKGVENIYATEQKTSKQVTENRSTDTDTKNQENDQVETSYILVKDADGSQRAVAVTQLQPIVKGVVVVCDGGSSIAVQQQVTDAVTTALDISSTKVCVVSAK